MQRGTLFFIGSDKHNNTRVFSLKSTGRQSLSYHNTYNTFADKFTSFQCIPPRLHYKLLSNLIVDSSKNHCTHCLCTYAKITSQNVEDKLQVQSEMFGLYPGFMSNRKLIIVCTQVTVCSITHIIIFKEI